MLLNCDNAVKAYVQLFDLLTVRQRMRLLDVSDYVFRVRYMTK